MRLIDVEGPLLYIEQEGGYACPSITVGDVEAGTAVEDYIKDNKIGLIVGDHRGRYGQPQDGFVPGRWRLILEKIGEE